MNYFSATTGTSYPPSASPDTGPRSVLVQGIGGLQRRWVGMEQLFQVWDYKRNEPQSFHGTKQEAEEEASRLNANQAMDWNGLQRYIVMEAND